MFKLVKTLPTTDKDRQYYLEQGKNILLALTSSAYLSLPQDKNMSLLLHGCYHHFDAINSSKAYDNGLIWGDYFFLDALIEYRTLATQN